MLCRWDMGLLEEMNGRRIDGLIMRLNLTSCLHVLIRGLRNLCICTILGVLDEKVIEHKSAIFLQFDCQI